MLACPGKYWIVFALEGRGYLGPSGAINPRVIRGPGSSLRLIVDAALSGLARCDPLSCRGAPMVLIRIISADTAALRKMRQRIDAAWHGQARQKSLKRAGFSSVYLTVC